MKLSGTNGPIPAHADEGLQDIPSKQASPHIYEELQHGRANMFYTSHESYLHTTDVFNFQIKYNCIHNQSAR